MIKKPIVLRIYKGEKLLGVKQFLDAQIVIGQPGDVQVALEGDSVSLIHASIEERQDGYYISDLGSTGGTFQNDQQVLDNKLNSGDVLKVGEYVIEFFIGPPKPKTSSTDATQVGFAVPSEPVVAAPTPQPVAPPVVEPPVTPATPPPAPKAPEPPVSLAVEKPVEKTETAPAPVPPTPTETASAAPSAPATPSAPAAPAAPSTPKIVPKAPPAAASQTVKPAAPPPKPAAPPVPQTPQASATPPPQKPSVVSFDKPKAPPAPPVSPVVRTESAAGGFGGETETMAGPRRGMSGARSSSGHSSKGHGRRKKTFAPSSKYSDLKEFIKPSKGTVVEILVAWRERVISTYHFSEKKVITVGSKADCDIVLPVFGSNVRKMPLVKIDTQAVVMVTPEMRGELIKGQTSSNFVELLRQNKIIRDANNYNIPLDQGEMVRVELSEEVSVIVRYVSDSPKPLAAPLLDLTATETTGIVLTIALVATLWLYMKLYSPNKGLDDLENEEPLRTAQILLTPPTPPPPLPKPPEPTPEPVATPPPPPPPTPKKVVVKVEEKKVEAKVSPKKAETVTNLTTKQDPGKSANAAPNKNKTGPRIQTSVKQGGAIKTSKVEGAQMQSKNRDVTKSGVFSAFGSGGQQDQLAQSTTGSGELAGLAGAATGKAGSAVNRAGQGLGSELKDTGVGGTGKSLEGIAGGVGTSGRGSGNSGYGTGGLGNKAGTKIVTGGAGEQISGSVDREAIRRVILANLRVIKACYERELNRHPDLYGKVVLSWVVGEQGRVLSVKTKSNELGNADVANCMMEKLKTWRFPEPPSNSEYEVAAYPFLFSN